jgi:hypothetical protein
MSSQQSNSRDLSLIFRWGLVLWCILTLLLTASALLLMFCDTGWVTYFERVQPVNNFIAQDG